MSIYICLYVAEKDITYKLYISNTKPSLSCLANHRESENHLY